LTTKTVPGHTTAVWGSTAIWPTSSHRSYPPEIPSALGCEGIVSKRLGSPYRPGRVDHWLKIKNPTAPAVKREAKEGWRK